MTAGYSQGNLYIVYRGKFYSIDVQTGVASNPISITCAGAWDQTVSFLARSPDGMTIYLRSDYTTKALGSCVVTVDISSSSPAVTVSAMGQLPTWTTATVVPAS